MANEENVSAEGAEIDSRIAASMSRFASDLRIDSGADDSGADDESGQNRDLGQNIGSKKWWRDASLLGSLIALTLSPLLLQNLISTPQPTGQAQVATLVTTLGATLESDVATPVLATLDQAEAAPSSLEAAEPDVPEGPKFNERSMRVARGDTLMEMVSSLGVARTDAYHAIEALSDLYNPRKLRIGQDVIATLREADGTGGPMMMLAGLSIRPEPQVTYVVLRNEDGGYDASALEVELRGEFVRASGTINSSLYAAAQDEGMSQQTIADLIRVFSYDVDFQREIREGDSFEVMYERFNDTDGNFIKDGDILFGNLTLRGKELSLYRYVPSDDGIPAYFDKDGNSTKKLLMRTPIDGARLTGRFGNRKHPILGYMKAHRGIDFGAGRGTPIMAAGNGVIEYAARFGSFGNYVRIRHNGTYKTAYAHMNGFAKGIKKGRTVQQGQIIGYVGSTGRSTGPHLHYEVHYNGKQVNPLSLDLPTGRKLEGPILASFMALRANTDTLIASLGEEALGGEGEMAALDTADQAPVH